MKTILCGGPADGKLVDIVGRGSNIVYDGGGSDLIFYFARKYAGQYPIPGWQFVLDINLTQGGGDDPFDIVLWWYTGVYATDGQHAAISDQIRRLNESLSALDQMRRSVSDGYAHYDDRFEGYVQREIANLLELTHGA